MRNVMSEWQVKGHAALPASCDQSALPNGNRWAVRPTVTDIAAVVVLGVWAGFSVAAALTGDYTGLQIVTPIMVIIAGALFVAKRNGKL